MGYTTNFIGSFKLNKPLTLAHKNYLDAFSDTRRMKRNAEIASTLPDPIREAAGFKTVGIDGEFYVGGGGFMGQDHDKSVVEGSRPPSTQAGLWCKWAPNADGTAIEWNGYEKFYDYIEWIEYIIKNFLAPVGYILNGTVKWEGEESSDMGQIVITNNSVEVKKATITYS